MNRLKNLEDAARVLIAFQQMSEQTREIFLAGLRALAAGRLTHETFEPRVVDMVNRHRRGEPITQADLRFD